MDGLNNFDWNFCYEHANSLPFGYSSWCAEQDFNLPLPEVNLSEMLPEISMDDFEEVYYANPLEDILDDNPIEILDDKPQIEQVFNLPLPEVDETALDNLSEMLPEISMDDFEEVYYANPLEDILDDYPIEILDDKPQIEQVFNLPLPEVDETALDNLGERLPEFSLNDLEDILDDNPIEDILGDELKTTPITLDMEKQIVVQTLMFEDPLKVSARFLDYAAMLLTNNAIFV